MQDSYESSIWFSGEPLPEGDGDLFILAKKNMEDNAALCIFEYIDEECQGIEIEGSFYDYEELPQLKTRISPQI